MADSFWLSLPFVGALLVTLGVGLYSYVYLPRGMRRAYRQSLLTLARAVESRDAGSEGHGERVAENVVAIAREMKLSAADSRRMEYAAFLQDIGNARVPHAILGKTGRYTPEEFEQVKAHTAIGADMVEQVKFLGDIAPTIRHHHENWDGSGYPAGLKGEDIPLGSRILAVCTSYDAMTRERSYRPRMDEEKAVTEIREGAGIKYDPRVVEAFLMVLKRRQQGRLK